MASPPRKPSVTRDDIPDAPAWFNQYLEQQNPFTGGVAAAFDQGLTFGENFKCEVKTVSLVAPAPVWRTLTLATGWSTSSAWHSPAYRIDWGGRVYTRGLVINGGAPAGGTAIATLPSGYAPGGGHEMFAVGDGSPAAGCVFILSSGVIQYQAGAAASGVGLYGINFNADNPAAPEPPAAPWPYTIQHGLDAVAWVVPMRTVSSSLSAASLTGAPVFDWSLAGDGSVLLRDVRGLVAGQKYQVTLLLVAG